MKIDKELIENKWCTVVNEKKVEEAKIKSMSNERRAITEIFKEIKSEAKDVSNMEK